MCELAGNREEVRQSVRAQGLLPEVGFIPLEGGAMFVEIVIVTKQGLRQRIRYKLWVRRGHLPKLECLYERITSLGYEIEARMRNDPETALTDLAMLSTVIVITDGSTEISYGPCSLCPPNIITAIERADAQLRTLCAKECSFT
jgi:hypothetical protein